MPSSRNFVRLRESERLPKIPRSPFGDTLSFSWIGRSILRKLDCGNQRACNANIAGILSQSLPFSFFQVGRFVWLHKEKISGRLLGLPARTSVFSGWTWAWENIPSKRSARALLRLISCGRNISFLTAHRKEGSFAFSRGKFQAERKGF